MPRELPARRPERAPTHPGAILREDVLPALRMTVTRFAGYLGVTRQQVHRVLAEQSAVSPDMAWRLGKLLGNGPDLWIRMQEAHDLWHARQRLGKELDRIPTLEPVQ